MLIQEITAEGLAAPQSHPIEEMMSRRGMSYEISAPQNHRPALTQIIAALVREEPVEVFD